MSEIIVAYVFDENGEAIEHAFPAKREFCDACDRDYRCPYCAGRGIVLVIDRAACQETESLRLLLELADRQMNT